MIREMINSRELIWNLVKRDLKTRYKSSILGFFWSFGKPLLLMLILWFVFSTVIRLPQFGVRNPDFPFPLHLLTGILAWTYFTGGLMEAMYSVYQNSNLIKKVKLNPAVFPVSSVLSNLVNYLLALLVLFGFMIAYGAPFTFNILLLPFIILLQTFLMITLSLLLSALFVFYRDVASLLEVFMTGLFYASPIIYPFWLARDELLQRGWKPVFYLYILNPLIPILAGYRRLLFAPLLQPREISDTSLMILLGYALGLSLIFYFLFKKIFKGYARRFADEL